MAEVSLTAADAEILTRGGKVEHFSDSKGITSSLRHLPGMLFLPLLYSEAQGAVGVKQRPRTRHDMDLSPGLHACSADSFIDCGLSSKASMCWPVVKGHKRFFTVVKDMPGVMVALVAQQRRCCIRSHSLARFSAS
jgi:hypothetical protein